MARGLKIATVSAKRFAVAGGRARFGLTAPSRRRAAVAEQVRLACEELGPAFVKVGQMASVRPDVFSAELVFELEKLQDRVPPLPGAVVRAEVARALGRDASALFASFHDEPIASASIAQVHEATLREEYRPVWGPPMPAGTRLAVKVVRPDAPRTIAEDLRVARRVVGWLRALGLTQRVSAHALLDEFAASLASEVDMRNEGRVADRFGYDFRGDPRVLCPRTVWTHTTRRVLTMEFVDGWRLTELTEADRRGVDSRALAEHGALAFMRQVLELGRYHADLHPANIFVTPDSRIAYLDFGIVGRLEPPERVAIAQVLAALTYGDAERALVWSGRLGVDVPAEKHEAVRRELGELMERTLSEEARDVRHFGMGFLGLLGRHGVVIPVGYGLLVKALVTVEGVARALYPDIDIIATARPYATRVLAREMGRPERLAERLPVAMRAALRELAR